MYFEFSSDSIRLVFINQILNQSSQGWRKLNDTVVVQRREYYTLGLSVPKMTWDTANPESGIYKLKVWLNRIEPEEYKRLKNLEKVKSVP